MDIVAGVDAGTETVKLVLLKDGHLIYNHTLFVGIETISEISNRILNQAVEKNGILRNDISLVGSTGVNAGEIPFANKEIPEAICCPLGINWLSTNAHTLINIGASKVVVMKCSQGRTIKMATSDKCASGVGISLRMVADVLAMNIEDIGTLSAKSTEEVVIQNTCAVFVETEIISLLHHHRKKPEDILKGVFRGMASRFYSLLLTVGIEDDIYMIGGVARNKGVVQALEEITGHRVLLPPDPDIIGALGAALAISNRGVFP